MCTNYKTPDFISGVFFIYIVNLSVSSGQGLAYWGRLVTNLVGEKMSLGLADIRKSFLEYFEVQDHGTRIQSACTFE